MKLATLLRDERAEPAVETANGRLALLRDLGVHFPSVRSVIEGGDAARAEVVSALNSKDVPTIASDAVHWLAPIPDPSKILCVALNNSAADSHLIYRPDFPVYFPKLPSALNGHGQPVEVWGHHGLVHPEPELAVIIGSRARNVSVDEAMSHVFGYAIFNDVTSVGMRKEDNFVADYPIPQPDGSFKPTEEHLLYPGRYKSADGFAPMGPYVVHKSLIPDPTKLRVRCWIDDELLMDDNTSGYHFTVAEVIHWISAFSTLLPGDVISLGTALHPDEHRRPISYGNINAFGDAVRIEIDGLGILKTPIRRVRGEDPRARFTVEKRFKSRISSRPR